MTNRITSENRAFYLDILREQTGLNLTIRANGYGYALQLEGKDISRNGLTGTTCYEVIYAMTNLLEEMKKAEAREDKYGYNQPGYDKAEEVRAERNSNFNPYMKIFEQTKESA